MAALDDFFRSCCEWVYSNLDKVVFSAIGVVVVYLVYRFLSGQVTRLEEQRRLEEGAAFVLNRVFKWISVLVVLAVVFAQFGVEAGVITGLVALAGGTVVGFAAMNTIGNAIAGIIVMASRPFRIGDRIFFNGQFADVVAIDLIYTRMITLDNVLISVPNQVLLTSEVDNYGKRATVRRSCSITAGYELKTEQVERALHEAAGKVDGVLEDPEPYVWITNFKDFAIEYTLYVFINQLKRLPEIDANLKRTVLETCRQQGIGISTPRLIRRVGEGNNNRIY